MSVQHYTIEIKTLVDLNGQAISQMKVIGTASEESVIKTLQTIIDGIRRRQGQRENGAAIDK